MLNKNHEFADLPRRIISGSIFALLGFGCLFYGGIVNALFLGGCLGVLCWEVSYIFSKGSLRLTLATLIMPILLSLAPILNYYDFYPKLFILQCCLIILFFSKKNFLKIFCFLYIALSILMFQGILQSDKLLDNLYHVYFVIMVVVASDIGGYVFGKLLGGPKIIEKISPNKTWSGSLGGIVLAVTSSIAFLPFIEYSIAVTCILTIFLAIGAQIGDFFESWLKRKFKVKDSGVLLPGHGGFFDRLDGLLAAAPIYMGLSYVL